jgi:hypothetical protein
MYRPALDAVAGSLFLTALVAMLPLVTLFVLLGVLRMTAWKAALVSLVISLVVAVVAYSMPAGQASMAGLEGAAFGFFPILWIVINAIWVYNMTVVTGHFDVLRRSFAKVSDDQRIPRSTRPPSPQRSESDPTSSSSARTSTSRPNKLLDVAARPGEIAKLPGDPADYAQARATFVEVAIADDFAEFLTLPAYERMA